MDRRGSGVRMILERSAALSGRRPRYENLDDMELLLTIHAAAPPAARPQPEVEALP
jgi:ATP-dependent DNA helicase RecG